jgi:ankyrin repeat protein
MENLTTQLAELFAAIQAANVQQIRRLLAANVSPNQCNAEGKTALMVAAQIGNADIMQMLCAAAASRPRSAQIFFEPGFETGFEASFNGFNADSAIPFAGLTVPFAGFAIAPEFTLSPSLPEPLMPEPLMPEPSALTRSTLTSSPLTNSLPPSPIASHPANPTFATAVQTAPVAAQVAQLTLAAPLVVASATATAVRSPEIAVEDKAVENKQVNSGFDSDFGGDLDSELDSLFSRDFSPSPQLETAPQRDLDQALVAAIARNDVRTVEALLKSGVSFRPANWYDTPVLVTAAAKGYTDIVQALIIAGANVNSGYDRLPLHIAAEQGHLAVVQHLLNSGACLHDREESGRTALMCAAAGGHLPIVQTLIARGANANAACRGETALMLAAQNGHQAVYQFLQAYAQA